MRKRLYYFDQETCNYKPYKLSPLKRFFNISGIILLCLGIGLGGSLLYSKYFPSLKERQLTEQNHKLSESFTALNQEVQRVDKLLNILAERDDNIYRVIFEVEPLQNSSRNLNIGGNIDLKSYRNLTISQNIKQLNQKLNKLKHKVYTQSKSYDELLNLARNKQKLISSIPAIQPISNKDLTRLASGFGNRIHPIYKVKRMHTGCDFSAPNGTPIYATGDGKVITAKRRGGYGRTIEIRHGSGYVTRYAHLSKYDVRVGQRVKRGQLIGKVGNSGLSVAPHLHYEVLYKGRAVNPVNYFHNDLTPEQYEKLLQLAVVENQSLGY